MFFLKVLMLVCSVIITMFGTVELGVDWLLLVVFDGICVLGFVWWGCVTVRMDSLSVCMIAGNWDGSI